MNWLTPTCPQCGKASVRRVAREQAESLAKRVPVQVIFPELGADEREVYISGIHSVCFTAMFGPR